MGTQPGAGPDPMAGLAAAIPLLAKKRGRVKGKAKRRRGGGRKKKR